MRIFVNFIFLLVALCFAALAGAVPSFSPPGIAPDVAAPAVPFQQPRGQTTLRIWTRVRDAIIETIWRVPAHRKLSTASKASSASPLSSAPSSLRARYGDDVVLRFTLNSPEEMSALVDASNVLFLDVWASTDKWVDIRLAKDVVPSLLGLLPASLQTSHVPLIHDLAQAVYQTYPSTSQHIPDQRHDFSSSIRSSPDATNIFFRDYQPLSVILPWMRLMASMFSSHVRLTNVGMSFEGREIPALRVGVHPTNPSTQQNRRKTIIVTGGTHAREWIGVSTVNYIAYSMITAYGKSRPMTKLLEEFDWVFIPTMNPDGYVYTWETDRLWRKNRQDNDIPFCPGLDLDRSWGYEWDGDAMRSNPCSESYAGDGPFDGREAERIAEWARNETESDNVEFLGFLDLHSYSQQVLYPYSYSCSSVPPTLENLEELAIGIVRAIHRTNQEFYDVASACGSIGPSKNKKTQDVYPQMEKAGGSALDWFYHELRVRYAYQIKLRDRGSYGFLLPKENIIPTGKELFNAVVVFGKFLLGEDAAGLDWEAEFQLSEPLSSSTESRVNIDGDGERMTTQSPEAYHEDEEVIDDEMYSQDEYDEDNDSWERRRRRR